MFLGEHMNGWVVKRVKIKWFKDLLSGKAQHFERVKQISGHRQVTYVIFKCWEKTSTKSLEHKRLTNNKSWQTYRGWCIFQPANRCGTPPSIVKILFYAFCHIFPLILPHFDAKRVKWRKMKRIFLILPYLH